MVKRHEAFVGKPLDDGLVAMARVNRVRDLRERVWEGVYCFIEHRRDFSANMSRGDMRNLPTPTSSIVGRAAAGLWD